MLARLSGRRIWTKQGGWRRWGGALGLALKEMERLREVAWSSSIWFKAEPP